MNAHKAIEILKSTTIVDEQPFAPDLRNAISLSIEALKYYQKVRSDLYFNEPLPLPGETE